MKQRIIDHLPYIMLLIIISYFALSKNIANDLFFDLKTGESILKYGVDLKDHFSFIPDLVYLYHHWFYDLIIYFVFSLFKYKGILMFYFLFTSILSISLYLIYNKSYKNKFLSFAVTALIIWIYRDAFSTRVQTITFPMFLLYIYFLEQLYTKGNKKYAIYLILISLFINNNHMTMWFLTIIFMLPYLVEMLLYYVRKSKRFAFIFNNIDKKITFELPVNKKQFLITCLILFLIGFLTPLGMWPYKFAFVALKNNMIFLNIIEMQNTVIITDIFFLLLIIICFMIIIISKHVKSRDIMFTFGLFILSLIAIRNKKYFIFILPIILSKYLNLEAIKLKKIQKYKNFINISFSIMLFALIVTFGLGLVKEKFDYNINENYPSEIVKYLKENTDYKNIRLFNDFDYGSYLEYNDIPVFVDSRAEVYIKDFNGKEDILPDVFYLKDENRIERVINKYSFNYFLVYVNSDIGKYLKNHEEEYELVMKDGIKYALYKSI